jgi:hypothetical protein
MVPLHVVEAVRNELSTFKGKNSELEEKLMQFQMMPPPAAQPAAAAPAAPTDPLDGMDDDELVNVKDIRKIIQTVKQDNSSVAPLKADFAKLQLHVMDPNYETTIRNYLPEMVTVNPMLKGMIMRAENPLAAALAVARMSPKFIQAMEAAKAGGTAPSPPKDILSDLQRIIENAAKPGAPGAMGGGGGAVAGNDRFRTMNDADFDNEVQRVLSGMPR